MGTRAHNQNFVPDPYLRFAWREGRTGI